jgi:hypothetical protein
MLFIIYLVSIAYCVWKMTRSYMKTNEVDPTYASPGLETLAILLMAPLLMAVDVSMTWIRKYKEAKETKIFDLDMSKENIN